MTPELANDNRRELQRQCGGGLKRAYLQDGWLGSTNEHKEDCPMGIAISCSVGVACEHERDCCPICDKCTCEVYPDE